jgi:hypothetical protein
LIDVGYTKVIGDGICACFQHERFLSVDLLTSPIYAAHPSEFNTIEDDENIIFYSLSSKNKKIL